MDSSPSAPTSVSVSASEPSTKKRRIPKACASCRSSKLRCDGGKPCLRCREKNTWCDYVKPPTPTLDVAGIGEVVGEKLARLEAELSALRSSQSQPHGQIQFQVQPQVPTQEHAAAHSPNPNVTAMTLLQMQAQKSSYSNAGIDSSNITAAPSRGGNNPAITNNNINASTGGLALGSHELYSQFRDHSTDTNSSISSSARVTGQRGLITSPSSASDHRNHQSGQSHFPDLITSPNSSFEPHLRGQHQPVQRHHLQHQQHPPPFAPTIPGRKRKRAEFELSFETPGDVVSKGIISYHDAELYFETFFGGCDHYVPVFDPQYDTFESVRARSSMLFDVICAVGCRAEHGPNSPPHQTLLNTTKSPLCAVILGTAPHCIETIQALLIDACYSEKGWLLTSMALKLALELDLPDAYRQLSGLVLGGAGIHEGIDRGRDSLDKEERLMRESRVWFGVWVLEHILSIDCGKSPGVKAVSGEGLRRCRVLLRHPAHTALDFRLLAQVELNSIRALAHDRLSPASGQDGTFGDDEMSEIVQGTRIDLSVWLSDWENLVESHIQNPEERASLITNFKIQRDWSEMTMLCKGLQGMGIENVAIMSDSQRNLIHLAKNSAKRHLSTIVSDPGVYLATFRYGMDFVWAKCAFSVLLLLKLARIAPAPSSPQTEMTSLIVDAKILLSHLGKIRGSSNIYLRILALSVEKCEKALNSDGVSRVGSLSIRSSGLDGIEGDDSEGVDPDMDFQSYIPREFTLEWNFPGLTFCWIPCDWMDLFADFGSGFEAVSNT